MAWMEVIVLVVSKRGQPIVWFYKIKKRTKLWVDPYAGNCGCWGSLLIFLPHHLSARNGIFGRKIKSVF